MPEASVTRSRPASKVLASAYEVDGFIFVKKPGVPEKTWILRRQPYHKSTDPDKNVVHKNMIILIRMLNHYLPFRTHPNFNTILSQDLNGKETIVCQWISRLINGRKAFSAQAGAILYPITNSETALLLCHVVDDYNKNWVESAGTTASGSITHNLRQSWAQMMRTNPEELLLQGPPSMGATPTGGDKENPTNKGNGNSKPVPHPPGDDDARRHSRATGSSSSRSSRSRSPGRLDKGMLYRERSPIRQVQSSCSETNRSTLVPAAKPTLPTLNDHSAAVSLTPVSGAQPPRPAELSSTSGLAAVEPDSRSLPSQQPRPAASACPHQPTALPMATVSSTQHSSSVLAASSSNPSPPSPLSSAPTMGCRQSSSATALDKAHESAVILPTTPAPTIYQSSPAVPVVHSATGARFGMLWEELQTEMTTQIETLVTAQVERAVTERNADIMADVDTLRQDVDAVRNNQKNVFGALTQTLKEEHKATVEGLQAKVAEVEEASKTGQEVCEREVKGHQQEVQALKQEVETLIGSNKDLTKRLEKMEWVFQGMAQLYGGNGQEEPSAGQP